MTERPFIFVLAERTQGEVWWDAWSTEDPMKPGDIYAYEGVFPAVKCAICDTLYPAGSEDFVAFHGNVTVGLETMVIGVPGTKRPKRGAVSIVCRTPSCVRQMTLKMLGVDTEEMRPLWIQVMKTWAAETGLTLDDPAPSDKKPLRAKRKR